MNACDGRTNLHMLQAGVRAATSWTESETIESKANCCCPMCSYAMDAQLYGARAKQCGRTRMGGNPAWTLYHAPRAQ